MIIHRTEKEWKKLIRGEILIERTLARVIQERIGSSKAVILLGARQTGKTTLLRRLFEGDKKAVWFNGDEPDVQRLFAEAASDRLQALIAGKRYIVIDEAQRIPNIGIRMKLITDTMPGVQLFASGSSSFELANSLNEPLTGRKFAYQLFPLSFQEMADHHGLLKEQRLLNHRLVYGYYPDVVMSPGEEEELLHLLSDSYLYKDILMWEGIKKPDKLMTLLQSLAYQIGNEVSFSELGRMSGLNNETVEKYIQLLEKTFVVFRLGAFSRNLRKELKKSRKIYFYDNGIRNAVLADFSPAETRHDIGALWENFLVSERRKKLQYQRIWANSYFWRTQDQQEIDYLEQKDGVLHAFEFKWSSRSTRKVKVPAAFRKAYPDSTFSVITPDNFEEFAI